MHDVPSRPSRARVARGSASAAILAATIAGASALADPPKAGEIVVWPPQFGFVPPPGPFKAVAVGSWHCLAQRPDNTFEYWPAGNHPPPPGPFTKIEAAGRDLLEEYYVGIRADGQAEFWGSNLLGPHTTIPPGQYKHASWWAVGGLLLRQDGSLVQLGLCGGACVTLPPGPFETVDVGMNFAVAIRADGTLFAWGQDPSGYGVLNPPAGTFSAVAAGATVAIAIRTDGTLTAWGANFFGQLNVPSGTFKAIDVGDPNTGMNWWLALRTDGSLVAWGQAIWGKTEVPRGRFVAIGTGEAVGMALAGCYADCNDDGQTTVADFGCFQTRFISASQYADCTGEGQFTVADFGCFQTQFVAGCP